METHIKLEIPVGMAIAKTNPVIVYVSPLNVMCPIPHAHVGMIIWRMINTKNSGNGCCNVCLSEAKLELKLPENVINAKIHGIKAV